ncbi:SDR family NAD(P)-dependent oxidoreductase [Leptospira harrisiae]|uniref:3-ketoacyl-ACP reductase n=1 Tax=Leptospira harrisiae TaxID=2023189 RepID=A0A2N0AGC3_9LEPT|nr:SDR family NAD(P)-dependent oxidoreductase [Leptospira harrisiae]PJZ83273.1 3-ketoacyl-ACP reductase [Leptospira harrisiae]PKA06807.1 3-ketoacyl-ACP reductase [Leptospira harrisiae]
MNKDFWNDRVVVITGATSGIGKALYEELATFPCELVLVARRAAEISEPKNKHDGVIIHRVACDLADPTSVLDATEWIGKEVSKIDVLFNNAGITAHGRFDSLSMDVYRKTFATNFFGPIQFIRGLLPLLLTAKGNIVTTSTVSALYGVPGRAAYSASKSALHAALESLRIENLESGLGVSLVCVPYTDTALRTSGLDASGGTLSEAPAKGKRKSAKEVAHVLMSVAKDKEARLVTFNLSGKFLEWMRFFSPKFLEKILYKKLYEDFKSH